MITIKNSFIQPLRPSPRYGLCQRRVSHTALEYVVKDLLNCAGIKARREETGCFRGADENNNNRPDLSIWNMPQREGKVVVDVQVSWLSMM